MSDGSTVHACARRIGVNPVTGTAAAAIAVLSISDPDEGTSKNLILPHTLLRKTL